MYRRLSLVFVCIIAYSFVQPVKPARALGMTVSPAFIRLSVSDNKQTSSGLINLKNNESNTIFYSATVADVDTSSGTLLPLDSTSELTSKIFNVSVSEFNLLPNQSIDITVTANNLAGLSPGGHYACLYLKHLSDSKTESSVLINQVISVGIFLTKEDGVLKNLSYTLPDTRQIWFTLPKTQNIKVTNNGNVDVVPRGFIAITRGTKTYRKTIFNETSQPIFAATTKEYTVPIIDTKIIWPGRYQKTISLRYDGQAQQEISYSTFWYVPMWSFVVIGVVILVLFKTKKIIYAHKKR